jgi:hypothetical protein
MEKFNTNAWTYLSTLCSSLLLNLFMVAFTGNKIQTHRCKYECAPRTYPNVSKMDCYAEPTKQSCIYKPYQTNIFLGIEVATVSFYAIRYCKN